MSDPTEQPREHPSTYLVQDRSNQEEMTRLETQDKMLTSGMGGVLPELPDPTILRSVLDVGCGTGGWLMETARAYPMIERLVGGDISSAMMAYARAQAEAQQLEERVQFQTMDALRVLEFCAGSFDLVNQRAGTSWLRTWEWTKILLEYRRVARPGGIIRITEVNGGGESNSPALTKLNSLTLEAFYRSGRYFSATSDGIIGQLEPLMRQHGIEDIQTRTHTLAYRPDTIEGQYYYKDVFHWYRVGLPFLQKWTRVPSDYQQLYQQALKEMQDPDFVATMTLLTTWGFRPNDGSVIRMRGLR
jgi:ubiquinone/menaquinone biosynthesis C-methylase UbiE